MCDHCGCRQGAIRVLMDEHDEIARLGDEVRRLVAAGQDDAAASRLSTLLAVLLPHAEREEVGLFARLTAQGDFADHVADLATDHVSIHDRLTAVPTTDGTRDEWRTAVSIGLDELDRHIYRENFGLFPAAISVLDGDDWAAIDAVGTGAAQPSA